MTHSLDRLTPEIMAAVLLDYMTLFDSADGMLVREKKRQFFSSNSNGACLALSI